MTGDARTHAHVEAADDGDLGELPQPRRAEGEGPHLVQPLHVRARCGRLRCLLLLLVLTLGDAGNQLMYRTGDGDTEVRR
jgi:hypothetical protein